MLALTHEQAFQVLLLQAADEGRAEVLFGDSLPRVRKAVPPFLVGSEFPGVYLEHPLTGDPFLDVTLLLKDVDLGTRITSPAAGDHAAMLDWYAGVYHNFPDVSFGFELDTSKTELPMAAVHFQPRSHTELVGPFCGAAGEPERTGLYLDLAARMPKGWPLAFFGMFRGRPGSPLRVCGYLNRKETRACAQDPARLAAVFDAVGFVAYDTQMIAQVATLLAAVPVGADFQFDVFPDGSLGPTFAVDLQFGIERSEAVRASFTDGPGARVMRLLEGWGAADERWRLAADSAFARALPVELEDGGVGKYALTLMPQWVKARWTEGQLQPAKLYHLAHAGMLS